MSRAVPDINEVARNPAPIDDRVHWEGGKPSLGETGYISWEDRKKLNELIRHLSGERADSEIENSTVVKRSAEDDTNIIAEKFLK